MLSTFKLDESDFFIAYNRLLKNLEKFEYYYANKVSDWSIYLNYAGFFTKKEGLKFDKNDILHHEQLTPKNLLSIYEELK